MASMNLFNPKEIRKLRRSLGDDQLQFSRRLGVSKECVRLWELGQRKPSFDNLVALDRAMGKVAALANGK